MKCKANLNFLIIFIIVIIKVDSLKQIITKNVYKVINNFQLNYQVNIDKYDTAIVSIVSKSLVPFITDTKDVYIYYNKSRRNIHLVLLWI